MAIQIGRIQVAARRKEKKEQKNILWARRYLRKKNTLYLMASAITGSLTGAVFMIFLINKYDIGILIAGAVLIFPFFRYVVGDSITRICGWKISNWATLLFSLAAGAGAGFVFIFFPQLDKIFRG